MMIKKKLSKRTFIVFFLSYLMTFGLLGYFFQNSWVILTMISQLGGLVVGYLISLNYNFKQEQPEPKSAEETTLKIASETMPYLRQGLTDETAQKIAELIYKISQVDAVAITDRNKILGFAGAGCTLHLPGRWIVTNVTRDAIESGSIKVIEQTKDFNCSINSCSCPLKAAVVAPLICEDRVVGAIKLYRTFDSQISEHTLRLATGIAQLLSLQLELAEKDRQSQLVTKARLEALQAQIHPHFLFNVLNTIIAYTRNDPDLSRHLLVNLARFFRKTFNPEQGMITFREEMEYVETYLTLEKARYGDKLNVVQKVEPRLMEYKLPVLTIQPLVENAIQHGLASSLEVGNLTIIAKLKKKKISVLVKDNGNGIPLEEQKKIFIKGFGTGNGMGLSNVYDRICSIYGNEGKLILRSKPGWGTAFILSIPVDETVDKISDCAKR
jgi:two-component system LytT family sensor kinase